MSIGNSGRLKEFRCEKCNKLLFRALVLVGDIEVKCRHCHAVSSFTGAYTGELICLNQNCQNRQRVQDAAA